MPHRIVLVVLLLIGAKTLNAQDSPYRIALLPKEFIEQANSVTWEENYQVDVSENDKMKSTYRTAVAVFNDLGDDDISTYTNYDNDTDIKNIEIWVYDATGNEIEHYKKRDFEDVSLHDGFSIYTDDRALYLNYTPTTYPYTIVFESETESNTTAFIPSWKPIWGYYTGTLKSTYTLKYNPTNKPRLLQKNLSGFDISVTEGNSTIICEASNLKPIIPEAYSLPYIKIAPYVSFQLDKFYLKGVSGKGKDWKELGMWMENALLKEGKELPEGTISRVKTLVANETTNIEKARKIYEYLQNKVRYISVQIGIGGWKPMPSSDVDRLGYGDCKALTFYTKNLLEAVGVPSYYTVLFAGDEERNFERDFSGIMGNHAILGIPEGDDIIWLECTSQLMPFGFGGDHSDDRDVLVITPEGGKIVHTKKYSAEENFQKQSATITLSEKGAVKGTVDRISGGLQYEQRFGLENLTQDELERYYKNRWGYINGLYLQDTAFENDRKNITFTEKIKLEAPNYASKVGADLLLSLNLFNRSVSTPPRSRDRRYGFETSISYKDTDSITYKLPTLYKPESLPEPVQLSNKFGTYEFRVEKNNDNSITYFRTFIMNKASYPKEEYSHFRKFLRKVSRYDNSKILLVKQ